MCVCVCILLWYLRNRGELCFSLFAFSAIYSYNIILYPYQPTCAYLYQVLCTCILDIDIDSDKTLYYVLLYSYYSLIIITVFASDPAYLNEYMLNQSEIDRWGTQKQKAELSHHFGWEKVYIQYWYTVY